MVRSRVWTAGLCPSLESCRYIDASWSTEILIRSLTFSHHWQLSVDLKVWLVVRALNVLNHFSSPILGTVVTALVCVCVTMSQHVEENLYYQFWAYRLPMALLVYAVLLRRRQLQETFPCGGSQLAPSPARCSSGVVSGFIWGFSCFVSSRLLRCLERSSGWCANCLL